MEDDPVAVGILEERHVADAAVPRPLEDDALRLELKSRGRDVRNPQRDSALIRAERQALEKLPSDCYRWDKNAVCPRLGE